MKMPKVIKKAYKKSRNKIGVFATGQSLKKFDEVIGKLEKFKREGSDYRDVLYWIRFPKSFFSSRGDKEFLNAFVKGQRTKWKDKDLLRECLDYVNGEGEYSDTKGLLPYLKEQKTKFFMDKSKKFFFDDEEDAVKQSEDIKKESKKVKVSEKEQKKFEKMTEEAVKDVLE